MAEDPRVDRDGSVHHLRGVVDRVYVVVYMELDTLEIEMIQKKTIHVHPRKSYKVDLR